MTKSELITNLSEQGRIPHRTAEQLVSIVFESMSDTLIAGDRIEIRGFGSFMVKEYDAYTGRNPKTGEEIKVKSKKLPFFKVGKELRERVLGE